jgi:hypothetical protein
MKILETVEACEVTVQDDGSVTWTARGRIDGDGSGGNPYNDPCWQGETSLKVNGVSLNAEVVPFCVATPEIEDGVEPIVLGCQAWIMFKGKEIAAVVADTGPHNRLGEMSIAAAKALGIPDSPIDGGDDNPEITYRIEPGVPAVVNGITYPLQAS